MGIFHDTTTWTNERGNSMSIGLVIVDKDGENPPNKSTDDATYDIK